VGSTAIAGGLVLAIWGLVILPTLNVPAGLIIFISAVALIVAGTITLRLGIRRWMWRKRNIARTGGRYLRAWETTPTVFTDH
jgi:uncharacterized membrane-anchored protein